ncbi:hypothetical protein KUCAC02_028955 [Chaenocephalus aceratus]|uniref:Uncharacterized protein n=1 Tax=Chaenocephalus aceratus TaxID=36190 RepID=A0ACB9X473_CHAAC|nr:hypothetical protein KUCAC02_028955 [Chaenocephalus aceratus]
MSQGDMAALVRSSSWVKYWVPPKGTAAIVYGKGSFLKAVSHEEVLVFDDADSSWSLRSNYSCPVKSHNAPKDQFTA